MNIDPAEFREVLLSAFQNEDPEGVGALDVGVVLAVLQDVTSSMGLSHQQLQSLKAAVDGGDSGAVNYEDLASFLFEVLEHVAREQYIQDLTGRRPDATYEDEAQYE